jgi:hypothetical protein
MVNVSIVIKRAKLVLVWQIQTALSVLMVWFSITQNVLNSVMSTMDSTNQTVNVYLVINLA